MSARAPAAGQPAGQPAVRPPPKSCLTRKSSSMLSDSLPPSDASRRRLRWSTEERELFHYEPCQDPPVDEYKANLSQLGEIRRRRDFECQSQLSFVELVAELDAAHGGEGLGCLAPRRVEPLPGAWQGSSSFTWGQLMDDKPPPAAAASSA